ncbi:MAG: tetratricopeptide repeat protein [Cyclobacteriaceae bacterium]
MAKIIKFPISPPEKKGLKKVRKPRKPDLEEFGQLNLFDQSKVISIPETGSFFEEALVMDENGDERAEEFYLKAISENQSITDAYCNLGILKSKNEEPAKAVDYLTRCLKTDPRHFEAHYNLANVYSDLGNYELSKVHYEVAINIEPKFPNSYYNLGLVYISMRKYEEAINSIDQYINLSPEYDHSVANELLKTLNSIAQ